MIAPTNKTTQKRSGRSNSRTTSVILAAIAVPAVIAVIVVGVMALCFFMQSDSPSKNKRDDKGRKLIAEAVPQISRSEHEQKAKYDIRREKPKPKFWEVDASHTNGFSEAMIRKWKVMHYPPPCYTNTISLTEEPPEYAIFTHPSENRIAAYLTIEPGQSMVGSPVYGAWIEEDFLKSCEEPIFHNPEDDDRTRELKNAMRQVKIELQERIRNGERLSDILNETHRELQKLSAARQEMQSLIHEGSINAETEEELDDLIKAANMMLERKGIAPISANPIVRRNLRRRIQSIGR